MVSKPKLKRLRSKRTSLDHSWPWSSKRRRTRAVAPENWPAKPPFEVRVHAEAMPPAALSAS